MTDQPKLTAEEARIIRLLTELCPHSDSRGWKHNCEMCLTNAIRQAEDAVREEMSRPPIAGCCGGEVVSRPVRIHHKESCPIKAQAIREGK